MTILSVSNLLNNIGTKDKMLGSGHVRGVSGIKVAQIQLNFGHRGVLKQTLTVLISRKSGILFMTHGIDTILENINWECCDLVAQQTVIHLYIFYVLSEGG